MGGRRLDAVWWCYLCLGCATLTPWNSFINAADYWELRHPGAHADRLMTICYLPINLVVIAALVRWHAHVRPRLRILAGLAGFTLAVSAVPLLDLAPPSSATLAVVLALVAACGALDGVAQGALFGEAAALPPEYTQALVSGTAVSGVAVSLLRVLTKATLPGTEEGLRRSTNIYFAVAALVCGGSTAVYGLVLPRLPAAQRYRRAALDAALHLSEGVGEGGRAVQQPAWKPSGQQQHAAGWPEGRELELARSERPPQHLGDGDGWRQQADVAAEALLRPGQQHASDSRAWLQPGRGAAGLDGVPLPGSSAAAAAGAAGAALGGARLSGAAVLRCVWRLALANALIYAVTLSIFPGVLAEDVHSAELGSWYPVALLAAFNVADWAGKSAPGWAALRLGNERLILGLTCARVLFLPAFYLAAVAGAGPAAMGTLALLLGSSNGYLTACAMVAGAHAAPPAAADLAGNVMVLALIAGLCAGAFLGFLWLL